MDNEKQKEKELEPKQRMFVEEYLKDLNGTRAAIRAGYSPKTAKEQAYDLLTRPHIRAYADKLMNERIEEINKSTSMILNSLVDLATVDPSEMFDENGNLKKISDMPEHLRKSIASIESFEEFQGKGENKTFIGYTKKVKFWDKTKAIEMLGKYQKMFTDKVEHSGKIDTGSPLKLNLSYEQLKELFTNAEDTTTKAGD